jgi:hypothetical protein
MRRSSCLSPLSSEFSMYLPAQLVSRLGVGGAEPDYGFIDDIVRWFVRAFEQLCESIPIVHVQGSS